MANSWNIRKGDVGGGETGKLLEDGEIRLNAEGNGYEFLLVLGRTHGTELPQGAFRFPRFAYEGLVWNICVDSLDDSQAIGRWNNNAPKPPELPAEEGGTYTAQSGPGVPGDEKDKKDKDKGQEDAASASA